MRRALATPSFDVAAPRGMEKACVKVVTFTDCREVGSKAGGGRLGVGRLAGGSKNCPGMRLLEVIPSPVIALEYFV